MLVTSDIPTLNILGVTYTIHEVDCVDRHMSARGSYDNTTCEIRIDRNLPISSKRQTLMHEIMHAILDLLGYNDLCEDEEKVQGLGTALHLLFTTQDVFGVFETPRAEEPQYSVTCTNDDTI